MTETLLYSIRGWEKIIIRRAFYLFTQFLSNCDLNKCSGIMLNVLIPIYWCEFSDFIFKNSFRFWSLSKKRKFIFLVSETFYFNVNAVSCYHRSISIETLILKHFLFISNFCHLIDSKMGINDILSNEVRSFKNKREDEMGRYDKTSFRIIKINCLEKVLCLFF